jgi:dihydrofolate synthase/folylpolyglutamate synthase
MPGLETIRGLLTELDHPERGRPIVHIGGTSGKGSTATIVAGILRSAGYRVGLHVKPHLEAVEERFVVDGAPIESAALVDLIERIGPSALKWGPSWYELTVALAFEHFRAERVDVAVIEVGLGGRYDATNVVQPAVAVLTNVGLDHTDVLGDTVEKIAADKVGIFKAGAPTVSGVTQATVRAIVRRRCAEVDSPLWLVDEHYSYVVKSIDDQGSRFDLILPNERWTDLFLAPLGIHQVANASAAVAACVALRKQGFQISSASIEEALQSVAVPGRLEVVRQSPLVVLDGAHNPAKMEALAAALGTLYPDRPITGVLAFKRGHDLVATLRAIIPALSDVVLTTFDAMTDYGPGQAVDPGEVDAAVAAISPSIPRAISPDPLGAVSEAIDRAAPGGVVCVTGSLYLVGAVRGGWARLK